MSNPAKCYFCGMLTYITRVNTPDGSSWWVYEHHFLGEDGMLGREKAKIAALAEEILNDGE